MSGTGSIWSFAIVHPPVLEFYRPLTPYNVVVVELTEDPSIRLVGNLVDPPSTAPNSVELSSLVIGRQVRVVFERVTDVLTFPLWALA